GEPRYADEVYKVVQASDDGSFELIMDYFLFHRSTEETYSSKFVKLFGPPRDRHSHFFTPSTGYPSYFGDRPVNFEQLGRENQHYADIAASIQLVTEEILLKMARQLHRETGLKRLCLAGGVALNSVANTRLLNETPFEEIYVQPAAGDGGGALGAALFAQHMVLGRSRSFVLEHACWGQEHGPAAIEAFLGHNNISYERLQSEDK